MDPNNKDNESKMNEVLTDYGGSRVLSDYKRLTETQVLGLASKYGANYIITPTDYGKPHFEKVYEAADPTRTNRDKHKLYLYRICP